MHQALGSAHNSSFILKTILPGHWLILPILQMGKLSLGEGKITEVIQPGSRRSGFHHLITQFMLLNPFGLKARSLDQQEIC